MHLSTLAQARSPLQRYGLANPYITVVLGTFGIAHAQIPKVRYRAWPHTLGKVEVYTFGVSDRQTVVKVPNERFRRLQCPETAPKRFHVAP